ncbi:uncharacterized protein C2845_PM15G03540 [Panicum miliaceum]|uniref:Uncharacterized protein n=1 Tax=Panicum miliaceum TaxID=4540 RepID=A0A3L6QB97_PANMI|nr:uncharacterized protein C2845_PM15G03540 [Panicum miliaceum]
MGGPCGDKVVLLTKQKAPLIGVRYWRDVSRHVKEDIAECIMDHWDLETNEDLKKKIWKVAMEHYKDVDIVEWHYLNKYFATRKFKRDPVTGAEPRLLETWRTTHTTREGEWTHEVAESIYTSTARMLSVASQSDEEDPTSDTCGPAKDDQVFQQTYKETTGANYTRSRGHCYLSNPKGKQQILQERMIQERLERLKEQEPELEQLKAALRQELMGEFETVMAPYRQALLPENAQPIPATTDNTTEVDARSTGDNPDAMPVLHNQERRNQIAPRSILTTDRSNLAPSSKNASTANVAKSLFNENRGRGAGATAGSKYISSQQLVSGAKTRASKKKAQQHASQAT